MKSAIKIQSPRLAMIVVFLLLCHVVPAAQAQTDAAARGDGSQALGNVSTAIGSQVTACNGNSTAFGLTTKAENNNSFVVGRFNVVASEEECGTLKFRGQAPVFAVGIGLGLHGPVSERRKNGLTVLENGTTIIGTIRSPESNFGPFSTLNVVGNAYIDRDLRLGNPGTFTIDGERAGERFSVHANGNVGVGVANPGEKVTLHGKLRLIRDKNGSSFRGMNIWVGLARNQTSCNAACGNAACLVAYVDTENVQKTSCEATRLNKNCLCVGRK